MGQLCHIIRNAETNNIEYVESPYNGERSVLYNEALDYTASEEEAVNLWLVSNTPTFKEEVYTPTVEEHRNRIYTILNSIAPKYDSLELLHKGKQHTIYPDSLEYETIQVGNINTLSAFTRVGNEKVQIGKIRYRLTEQGAQIESSLLNKKEVYLNGRIQSISGKGVGTEIYKEFIFEQVAEGNNVLSDTGRTEGAQGVWNKFSAITTEEEGKNVIKSTPNNFQNEEPPLNIVLSYIEAKNVQQELSQQEQSELKVALTSTEIKDSDELLEILEQGFYPNGIFSPTRESLQSTELYTNLEIERILDSSDIQQDIQEFTQKLKNTDVFIENSIYTENTFQSVSSYETDILGRNKVDNPYINEKEAIQEVGGIKDQQDFEDALENTDLDYLKDAYARNPEIYNEFASYNRVNEKEINEEGELVNKTSYTKNLLEETLREPTSPELLQNISFLSGISEEVWNESPEDIKQLLKQVRIDAQDIALDLDGLEDMYEGKNRQEIQQFLTNVQILIRTGNISEFSSTYDEFYGIDVSPKERVVKVQPESRDKFLVYLETQASSYELFSRYGILPLGDNVYQRVKTDTTLATLYNNIYTHIKQNPNILPERAYYPVAFDKDGTLNRNKLNRADNQQRVIDNIQSFIRAEIKTINSANLPVNTETLERMYLYSAFFNTRLDNSLEVPNVYEQKFVYEQDIRNQEYLSTEFISDFRQQQIKEKQDNSQKYKDLYQHFSVNETGITLINNDPVTLQIIRNYIQNDANLRNYMLLHRYNFQGVIEDVQGDDVLDDTYLRNYYANYPNSIPIFAADYQNVSDRSVVTRSANSDFLRINNNVYESTQTIGDLGFYTQINVEPGYYKIYNKSLPKPELDINIENYFNNEITNEAPIEYSSYYNQKQEEEISQDLECQ